MVNVGGASMYKVGVRAVTVFIILATGAYGQCDKGSNTIRLKTKEKTQCSCDEAVYTLIYASAFPSVPDENLVRNKVSTYQSSDGYCIGCYANFDTISFYEGSQYFSSGAVVCSEGTTEAVYSSPISESDIFYLYSTRLPSNFSGGCTQTDSPASSPTPNSSKMYGLSTLIKIILVAAMLLISLSYAQDNADITITQYIGNSCSGSEVGTTQNTTPDSTPVNSDPTNDTPCASCNDVSNTVSSALAGEG